MKDAKLESTPNEARNRYIHWKMSVHCGYVRSNEHDPPGWKKKRWQCYMNEQRENMINRSGGRWWGCGGKGYIHLWKGANWCMSSLSWFTKQEILLGVLKLAQIRSDQIRCDSVLRLLLHFSILLLFYSSHISLYLIHQITHIKSTPSDAHNYQGPRFFLGEKVNLIIKKKERVLKLKRE